MKKFQITGRFIGSHSEANFDPRNEEWVGYSMDVEKFDIDPDDLEQIMFVAQDLAQKDENVTDIRVHEIEYEMEGE